nr:Hpt domain-containing protein [Gemmatimonadaceae bacterium]
MRGDALFAAIENACNLLPRSTGPQRTVGASDDVLDEESLWSTVGGDGAFLGDLVDLFMADAPTRLAELRAALANKDAAAMQFAAHSLKGASGSLAGTRVEALAKAVESLGRDGDMAAAGEVIDALETELAAFSRRLVVMADRYR